MDTKSSSCSFTTVLDWWAENGRVFTWRQMTGLQPSAPFVEQHSWVRRGDDVGH